MPPEETVPVRSSDHCHSDFPSRQLRRAAGAGEIETVTKLLGEGADLHSTDANGRCAIHYASGSGHVNVVQFLLEKRADANSRDRSGGTPMDESDYWAVKQPRGDNGEQRQKSLDCLKLLQLHGGQRSFREERSDGEFIDRRRQQLKQLADRRGLPVPWEMDLLGAAGLATASGQSMHLSGTEPLPTASWQSMHTPSELQPLGHSLGSEIAVEQPQAAEDFHSETSDDLTPPPTPLPASRAVRAVQEQWL